MDECEENRKDTPRGAPQEQLGGGGRERERDRETVGGLRERGIERLRDGQEGAARKKRGQDEKMQLDLRTR